jgi:RNA polymerase sigma-70 factor (ECF subfamily)
MELLPAFWRLTVGAGVKDDAQLIDEALAGNSAAFGQLVTKYQDRLFNTMVRVVGCREQAADVVQDAFVQSYLKLNTFQRHAAFYTWLYRIAFNLAATGRRRHRPTLSVDQAREVGDEPVAAEPDSLENLEQQERATQLHTALAQLNEEYRTVLVLREMEGYDYETIANMLDVPVGTVRSRLHRARLELRDQLKTVMQED